MECIFRYDFKKKKTLMFRNLKKIKLEIETNLYGW